MSHSKHTRPLFVRAPDRLREPWAPRSLGDSTRERRRRRALKELGLGPPTPASPRAPADWPLPRIIRRRPRPSFFHPVDIADVAALLRRLGPTSCYGLRSIELRQGSPGGGWLLGRLQVPGRVILFDQPPRPWLVSAPDSELRRFAEAGAQVEPLGSGEAVRVLWPEGALRAFMLHDVLLHELGHHLLQHHKGKRLARVTRRLDHERTAERHAGRLRHRLTAGAAR